MEVSKILKDKIQRDIITFFHNNQASVDTPSGVATWIKAEKTKVKAALKKLAGLGILVEEKVSSTTGYSYTRDKKIIKELDKKLKEKAH